MDGVWMSIDKQMNNGKKIGKEIKNAQIAYFVKFDILQTTFLYYSGSLFLN